MTEFSGPMESFNVTCFVDAIHELVRSDEVANALWLCDHLPAWYRDHPPKEITELKNEIMKRMATPSFYATDAGCELTSHPDVHKAMKHSLRGDMIVKEIKHLNSNQTKPILFDVGPGEAWVPRLLIHEEVRFTYYPIYVNHPSYAFYKNQFESALGIPEENATKIFFACEVIEHLWKEDEIRFEMNRHCGLADVIHLSTPLYTFDRKCQNWMADKKDLGHLRAYTPSEFFMKVQQMFPEYDLTLFKSQPMHIRGVLTSTKFEQLKTPAVELFK